ncbi:PIN domain-containing protein [Candidatus Palauibacter sp.]|uniref:PIN domain-containing protein n=1 Tax=Candidatus Palauibacter sp. TaxID=3101350 RepID=UPI003AF1E955
MPASHDRVLLDTNILLGLTRKAPWAEHAYREFDLGNREVVTFTSIVCKGEILAIAEKRRWARAKRRRLEQVLDQFPTVSIDDPQIVRAYARIDAWTRGAAVDSPGAAPPPKPALPMGKNDLWIAATAHAAGAALLSTDGDFTRLDGVWLKFSLVDQSPINPDMPSK